MWLCNITGKGLNPIKGSMVLEQTEPEPKISEDAVVPILI